MNKKPPETEKRKKKFSYCRNEPIIPKITQQGVYNERACKIYRANLLQRKIKQKLTIN